MLAEMLAEMLQSATSRANPERSEGQRRGDVHEGVKSTYLLQICVGDALPTNQDYILAKIPCRGTADAFSAAKAGGRMLVSPDCPLFW